jgi:EAL domain-containing protein (putative c-di-GMP-specific phosphodiesterase class I)
MELGAGTVRPAAVVDESVPVVTDARWLAALQAIAADADRIELQAQPIVELTSGAVVGYEMLSRFSGPWAANPDVWFAAAEHWGFNGVLQARVLRMGIAARAMLPPDTFLTVNVDPHLLADVDVADALISTGDLSRFVLELTEHTRTSPGASSLAVLAHIREAGGMIAMDDAGTGYAGLSSLLSMRPQIVKLDRDLITGLDTDPVKRALVEVFGDLAGRMDTWILAEGIETRAELDAVIRLGVPLAQGWALARPARTMLEALSPELVDHIRITAARSSLHDNVASLVQPVQVGSERATCGVVVDGSGRPLQVRDHHDRWAPAMTVAPSTQVCDAARRAMARPGEHRYAPLVCTDGRGRVLGIIGIDDMVTALSAGSSMDRGG